MSLRSIDRSVEQRLRTRLRMDEAPVSETTALLVTLLGLQILTAVVMITGHADSAGGPVGMSAALIVIRLVKQSRVSGR